MQNYHMGMDGFIWFTAVVEDRQDPAKLGRVRIRCLGFHTEDKVEIPTESLPWAHVMHPIHDPSMQGMGTTPSFLVEGTWVVGFFRDANELQQPIVMGTLPGYAGEIADTTKGFCDPSGTYPQNPNPKSGHNLGESDVNRLARGDSNYIHRILEEKQTASEEFSEIETAQSGNFNMPYENSTNFTQYPFNHVFESESGHVREYDDTTGQERIQEYHRVGTFYEVDAGGNKVVHVVGDNYEFIAGSNYINVKGDVSLTIDGNAETYVKEDYSIRCKNLNIEVEEDFDTFVKGNTTQFYGDPSLDVADQPIFKTTALGAVSQRYNTTMDFVFTEDITYTYGGTVSSSYNKAVTEVYGSTLDISVLGLKSEIAANYNLGSTGDIKIDAANINLNNGSKGAARVDDPAVGTDTAGLGAGTVNSTITSGSGSVKIGDSGNASDASALVLTPVPEQDVPVDERVNTQGADNTAEAGTGDSNPSPEGGGHAVPAVPIRQTREEIRTAVEAAGVDATDLTDSQQREAQSATAATLGDFYRELRGTPDGDKLVNEDVDFSTIETGETTPKVTSGSDVTSQNMYRAYLGVSTVGKKFGDMFDESEITDDLRERYPNKFFPSNYRITQLRGRPRLRIKSNAGVMMSGLKTNIASIAEKAAFDLGKQLLINSAFRTPAQNASKKDGGVGGAKKSLHMQGRAMDVRVLEMTKKEQIIFVESLLKNGAKAIGYYGRFLHFDDGRNRYWRTPPKHLIPTLRKYKIAPYKNG